MGSIHQGVRAVPRLRPNPMFIVIGLLCLGLGIRFTATHPEEIYVLGPLHLTWYHVLFAIGALSIIRGIWKWVND